MRFCSLGEWIYSNACMEFAISRYFLVISLISDYLQTLKLNKFAKKNAAFPKKNSAFLIDATGFEPAASASRTQRSTKLSHASLLFCCP